MPIRSKTDDFLDALVFGDPESAKAHSLTGEQHTAITFKMAVNTSHLNYLTVQFNGSETANVTMATVLTQSFCGHVSDSAAFPECAEINMCSGVDDVTRETNCGDPVFNGRYQFSTFMLPRNITATRTSVLTLAAPMAHGKHLRSQQVIAAWTHTAPWLQSPVAAAALPVPPPAPPTAAPKGGDSSVSAQMGYLRSQVEGAVERLFKMQLYGKEWDEVVAADPSKAVLTGAIWPHMDVSGEGQAAGLKRLSTLRMKSVDTVPVALGSADSRS
jgi:hypothetical protein